MKYMLLICHGSSVLLRLTLQIAENKNVFNIDTLIFVWQKWEGLIVNSDYDNKALIMRAITSDSINTEHPNTESDLSTITPIAVNQILLTRKKKKAR